MRGSSVKREVLRNGKGDLGVTPVRSADSRVREGDVSPLLSPGEVHWSAGSSAGLPVPETGRYWSEPREGAQS